jgi:large subunit ribosomal protein L28
MPRVCEICGKKTTFGKSIARRGRAKYLGGVGLKTTGITRRKFMPNLQKLRVQLDNGTVKRITVCTSCIRSDKVTKRTPRPKQVAEAK